MEKLIEKIKNLTVKQKIIIGIVGAILVIAIVVGIVVLVSGGDEPEIKDSESDVVKEYIIDVKTEGGKAFEKLEIHVYEDNTLTDLVAVGKTDENGTYSFSANASDNYVVVLKEVPTGYPVEEYYELKEESLSLVLEAQLLSADEVAALVAEGDYIRLGEVAADISVTVDGKTYTVSELLQEKKAVIINFWFEGCVPCKDEFPYMEEAYKQYSDKLEILAVNPYDGDDTSVAAYKADLGLTFQVAKTELTWANGYNITACPTTIVIDRYKTVAFIHSAAVPSTESFTTLFDYFTSDDYTQTTVKSLDDIVTKVEGGDGNKANPFEEYRTEFEADVAAGTEVYYQMYKVNGMRLEIADPNAYVVFNEQKYEAVDGKVSLILATADTYSPALFAIGNTASDAKTFAVTLSFVEGSSGNPFAMNLGDFNVSIAAGNESGVYYTYTATENGTLTLNCTSVTAGVSYDFSLYNTVSSALRNLSSDGDNDTAVSITVNAGDLVQISIGALPNTEGDIPATDFTFHASFEAGEGTGIDPNATVDYKITVTDQKGNAIAGVTIKLNGDIVLTTNESGVATTSLPGGNYIAVITAPSGYKEDSTEYIMTKYDHDLTVTLEKTTIVTKTYTVKVEDENGKAIAGAGVTVNGNYVKTDSNGKASFKLEEGSYSASAAADGYETASKKFGSSTDITVTLKKETVAVKEVTYTVSVVTYKDKAVKGVNVQFMNGDAVVAEVAVDDSGKATASLKEGTYTAIVSDDEYGSGTITLTASNNSVKLVAAKSLDMTKTQEVCEKKVVTIKLGASHVAINKDGDNYLFYTPTKSGKYCIRTTNTEAKVTYCGGEYSLSTPVYESNEYTINVDSSQAENDVAYVFSITGAANTVVIIERIGDAEEIVEIPDYEGTCGTPSKFTMTEDGSKLTYFDATATSSVTIVKGTDGYYHYGSANGPLVYINLESASYISINSVVNSQSFKNLEKNEAYNALMIQYTGSKDTMGNVIVASCLDSKYGVYPLNDDLMHMVKYGGKQMGWWAQGEANYLFGSKTVDPETAWLCLCGYVK